MTAPITDDEIAAVGACPAPHCLKCRFEARIRADAAKIAERDAEIARLRAVAEAARELTRWDWSHLLDDDDRNAEDVCLGVDRIAKALAALDDKGFV